MQCFFRLLEAQRADAHERRLVLCSREYSFGGDEKVRSGGQRNTNVASTLVRECGPKKLSNEHTMSLDPDRDLAARRKQSHDRASTDHFRSLSTQAKPTHLMYVEDRVRPTYA
jgi:hypothetical protein